VQGSRRRHLPCLLAKNGVEFGLTDMTAQNDLRGLTPGSRLDPVTQSRGYVGGGVFPAGPAGPGVIPDGYFGARSNSAAKAGVVFGVLAVPLGWIQVVGFLFTLLFGGLAIILGAVGLIKAGGLSARSGRYIAILALAIGVAVVVWKLIEGFGPSPVMIGA
jgi:hypothetical protein